jgi:hypothetical protein
LRLGDQHAIEGIFVDTREQTGVDGVVRRNRKQLESFSFKIDLEIGTKIGSGANLTKTDVGGNLPG